MNFDIVRQLSLCRDYLSLVNTRKPGKARTKAIASLPPDPTPSAREQFWRIYDPRLQTYVRFTSEEELRIWIEHQYSLGVFK